MKKIIIAIICAAVIITGIVACCIKSNNRKKDVGMQKIKLNEVTRSVFYAPQYLAISNGYFSDENIDLEITTGQGTDKVTTALLSGQSDIGLCGPEGAIYVYNEGKTDYIKVFAQLTDRDGSFLVSKNSTKNFSWNDLKGKTIIPGRKGGVPYMTLEYVLRKNGIEPTKDLTLDDSIQFSLMAGAFTGGNADYVTLFEPTASMTQDQGKGYIVASIGKESGEVPYTAYCATKSYIEKNQDTIQGFTNAIYKGEQWVKEHSAKEIAEKIQSFFPDTSVDSLEKSVQAYKDIEAWKDNPILKEEAFNRLQTIMKDAGELQKEAPYGDIVNNSFAERAK